MEKLVRWSRLRRSQAVPSYAVNVVEFLYGLIVRNNPTAQDVWNSARDFGFSFSASPTTVGPSAAFRGALVQQQFAGIGVMAPPAELVGAKPRLDLLLPCNIVVRETSNADISGVQRTVDVGAAVERPDISPRGFRA